MRFLLLIFITSLAGCAISEEKQERYLQHDKEMAAVCSQRLQIPEGLTSARAQEDWVLATTIMQAAGWRAGGPCSGTTTTALIQSETAIKQAWITTSVPTGANIASMHYNYRIAKAREKTTQTFAKQQGIRFNNSPVTFSNSGPSEGGAGSEETPGGSTGQTRVMTVNWGSGTAITGYGGGNTGMNSIQGTDRAVVFEEATQPASSPGDSNFDGTTQAPDSSTGGPVNNSVNENNNDAF